MKYVLNGLLISRTAHLAGPNSISGQQSNRRGRLNKILGERIGQRPVCVSFLLANWPANTRKGQPILWQDRQTNRPLFNLLYSRINSPNIYLSSFLT